jgi:hypothetical protein
MSFRSSSPASAIVTAIAWFGLAVLAFLAVWANSSESLTWWVKIAAALAGALVCVGNGIDAFSRELTVHRWALNELIFATVGVVLIVAAIFNATVLGLGRPLMGIVAVVYLVAAVFCASEARDLF